jgi:uncharacterized protein (UPF0261 family)
MTPHPVIIGTLDTKGPEIGFLKERFATLGATALVVDVGVMGTPSFAADKTREEVAARVGTTVAALLATAEDKVAPMRAMAEGATAILKEWLAEGRVAGVISIGGGVGTWVAASVMRALPLGLPKVLVSTLPYDIRPHLGTRDIVVIPSVADILGLNPTLRTILNGAAAALLAMAAAPVPQGTAKPVIGMTGLGITTPAVLAARQILEADGFEVASFHAAGPGGAAFEEWIGLDLFPAVLDLTTHEITDEVFDGTGKPGPERLETAGRLGIPQVLAPGGVSIISRGPLETVSAEERSRPYYRHSPFFTHVRVDAPGMRKVAEVFARKLNLATGPTVMAIPLQGFSDQDRPGGKIWDPEANGAFVDTLKAAARPHVRIVEIDANINDRPFVAVCCGLLKDMLSKENQP